MTDVRFAPDVASGAATPEALPTWRLDDLYPGRDSPQLTADLDKAERDAKAFEQRYAGRLEALSGAELGTAIATYEGIDEVLGRVLSYAYLVYAEDVSDGERGRFLQAMQERATAISSALLFFTLELNRLDDAALEAKLADPAAGRYRPWLRDLRAFKPYQLSDELEKLLHEKQVAGRSAWMRLFDEKIADLTFTVDGREMASAEALNCLSDTDPAIRQAAGQEIGRVLGKELRLFSFITNTLAKDKAIEDRWRGLPHPWSGRNLSNQVEDHVVDALVDSVRAAYPHLSHRYYALKARWFGGETIPWWDRNAPLPDSDDRRFSWDEARDTVLDAYGAFDTGLADIGRRFFQEGWIDAPARPGKAPGAFAHPTVPSAHPYILMNYLGRTRDVMTLAHELGHGVHQVLAAEQGHLLSDTPLTLAETASVFGEMMTFRSLLDATDDAKARKAMLAGKVEDMINTVVRQIAFFTFEQKVHMERQSGELPPERLNEIWLDVQRESLGPAVSLSSPYEVYWTYIPHFVHSPFYVYAYAFGDCLVNSLYAAYRDRPDGFADRYRAMLAAGGTLRHQELLKPFGLDAADPGFWQGGLSVIEGLIDELEGVADA